MKKIHYSLLLFAIVSFFSSCAKDPLPKAFITSIVNSSVTLYSENDSIVLIPLQRTYLTDIDVVNNQIIACGSSNWYFNILAPVLKIGLNDTILDVLEEHRMFLSEIENYEHSTRISSGSGEKVLIRDDYDYVLKTDFLKEITGYK